MKERPILFSGPMVRAIMEGRKTQTRRVIKPQPDFAATPCWAEGDGNRGRGWYCCEMDYPEEGSVFYRCPFGQPGDRLWVRETFRTTDLGPVGPEHFSAQIEYDADECVRDSTVHIEHWRLWLEKDGKRMPSIHMPRWASRITLEITGVRVQRLQEISEEDAKAEGVNPYDPTAYFNSSEWGLGDMRDFEFRAGFADVWRQIIGMESYRANPWVWVIEFKRI